MLLSGLSGWPIRICHPPNADNQHPSLGQLLDFYAAEGALILPFQVPHIQFPDIQSSQHLSSIMPIQKEDGFPSPIYLCFYYILFAATYLTHAPIASTPTAAHTVAGSS